MTNPTAAATPFRRPSALYSNSGSLSGSAGGSPLSANSTASAASFYHRRLARLSPLPEPISTPKPRIPFTDDEPFSKHTTPKVSLQVECIRGITEATLKQTPPTFEGLVKLTVPHSDIPESSSLTDFVIVADVSSSMSEYGKIEMVKKSVEWLINTADDTMRMTIIEFNERAERKTPLTVMNAAGKVTQQAVVHGLTAGGATNITAALELAAAVVEERVYKDSATVVLLITDGQDERTKNNPTARAAIDAIAKKALLACVGLGEDHDSKLLTEISMKANGKFEYCPDADAIPRVFGVLKGTAVTAAAMQVELKMKSNSSETIHKIPLIAEDQELLFPFSANITHAPYLDINLAYTVPGSSERTALQFTETDTAIANQETLILINTQINRVLTGKTLLESADLAASGNYKEAKSVIKLAITQMKSSVSCNDELTKQFIEDCEKALAELNNPKTHLPSASTGAFSRSAGGSHMSQSPIVGFSMSRLTPQMTQASQAATRFASAATSARSSNK